MIKVLFVCHGRTCTFLKWLKIKDFGEKEWYLYSHCIPILQNRIIINQTARDYEVWVSGTRKKQ